MLYFIVNPFAKKLGDLREKIAEKLDAENIAFDFLRADTKEKTRAIARELSESGSVQIVAIGGDGTLNDVLSGITVPENVELGLIPMGTGNDFAEAAKIPFGIAALDLILHSPSKYTDFIELGDGMRSMNIAGMGIDVDILRRAYDSGNEKRNKYYKALLASVLHYRGQKIEVTANGETFSETAYIAAICNGQQFGGGIRIYPEAVLDDGKLDVLLIKPPKRIKLLFELLALKRGKIANRPIARHIRCEEVRIVQTEGKLAELDGELVEAHMLNARVVSGKLRMFRG